MKLVLMNIRMRQKKIGARRKTRSTTITEDTSKFKSAITEHTRDYNHIMNWVEVEVLEQEMHKKKRWIREAIQVRKLKEDVPMNRDEGNYQLAHVWDSLLRTPSTPPGRNRQRHS